MKNDPLCIKEDVCDMAVCDGALHCNHAVLKSAVLTQRSDNTGSPKCRCRCQQSPVQNGQMVLAIDDSCPCHSAALRAGA
jgi:hypothetical protein